MLHAPKDVQRYKSKLVYEWLGRRQFFEGVYHLPHLVFKRSEIFGAIRQDAAEPRVDLACSGDTRHFGNVVGIDAGSRNDFDSFARGDARKGNCDSFGAGRGTWKNCNTIAYRERVARWARRVTGTAIRKRRIVVA